MTEQAYSPIDRARESIERRQRRHTSHQRAVDTATPSRVAGLDVLRGVAIALVLLRHARPSLFGGSGIVGVVMFFTLSGFLITGVLTNEYAARTRLRLGRFYRNRALRLWPALLVMLAVFAVVESVTNRLHDAAVLHKSLALGAVYLSDVPTSTSSGLGHLWTLAIEEQFYLVWPFVLMFGFRTRRVGLTIAAVAALMYVVLLGTVAVKHADIIKLYSLPTSWAITLLIGGAAYLWRERLLTERWLPLAAVVGVATLAVLLFPELKVHTLTYVLGGPVIALSTAAIVLVVSRWERVTPWLLPLKKLGLISYAVYLWNLPIVDWIQGPSGEQLALSKAALATGLSIVAGAVSWQLVERPFRLWRRRLDSRTPSSESR